MADKKKTTMTEKKALTVLYDVGEQVLDRTGESWPELVAALRFIKPKTKYGPGPSTFLDSCDERKD